MDSSTSVFGICRLHEGSYLVTDADEEVFLLYTDLAGQQSNNDGKEFRGLGYLDNHKDVLTLEFTYSKATQGSIKGAGNRRPKKKSNGSELETMEVQLAQDKTALRSRKGDTGSVLWRASAEFAQLVLRQCHSGGPDIFIDRTQLKDANVLELGSGTGLLGVIFARLVRRYTATDIQELVPLISKNLALNGVLNSGASSPSSGQTAEFGVVAEALDWVSLHNAAPSMRRSTYAYPPIDLLLVIDCIYHPSLLPSLVDTIDHLATSGRTTVLVIVELRAEDVVREFLELWLRAGDGAWEIWHAHDVMKGPYAVWVAKKMGNT